MKTKNDDRTKVGGSPISEPTKEEELAAKLRLMGLGDPLKIINTGLIEMLSTTTPNAVTEQRPDDTTEETTTATTETKVTARRTK